MLRKNNWKELGSREGLLLCATYHFMEVGTDFLTPTERIHVMLEWKHKTIAHLRSTADEQYSWMVWIRHHKAFSAYVSEPVEYKKHVEGTTFLRWLWYAVRDSAQGRSDEFSVHQLGVLLKYPLWLVRQHMRQLAWRGSGMVFGWMTDIIAPSFRTLRLAEPYWSTKGNENAQQVHSPVSSIYQGAEQEVAQAPQIGIQ